MPIITRRALIAGSAMMALAAGADVAEAAAPPAGRKRQGFIATGSGHSS